MIPRSKRRRRRCERSAFRSTDQGGGRAQVSYSDRAPRSYGSMSFAINSSSVKPPNSAALKCRYGTNRIPRAKYSTCVRFSSGPASMISSTMLLGQLFVELVGYDLADAPRAALHHIDQKYV